MAKKFKSFKHEAFTLYANDCLDVLKAMPDNSVGSIVTDPPYGLSFMNKHWDYSVPSVEIWAECLRVLKPGGFLLAFAGTRTQHRMAVNIEDAGFEIRDLIMWVHGQGFPKSQDASKALDKAAGAKRKVVGVSPNDRPQSQVKGGRAFDRAVDRGQTHETIKITEPSTDLAKKYAGYGTALKPAVEPITVARKPLDGNLAQNLRKWGVGALNIGECRVELNKYDLEEYIPNRVGYKDGISHKQKLTTTTGFIGKTTSGTENLVIKQDGRWPANLIHDGSPEVVGLFPEAGGSFGVRGKCKESLIYNAGLENRLVGQVVGYGDKGSAARFFYVAKASKSERNAGLEGHPDREKYTASAGEFNAHNCFSGKTGDAARQAKHPDRPRKNHHPTVKPVNLMRYLVKLVTPPDQICLDPFMGSGTTGIACMREQRVFLGIERELDYARIAKARILASLKAKK
jgi:DNA modification methylase